MDSALIALDPLRPGAGCGVFATYNGISPRQPNVRGEFSTEHACGEPGLAAHGVRHGFGMPPASQLTVPFTRAEALAAGLSISVLNGPRFRRVFRDTYVPTTLPLTTELRARAALRLAPPGAVVARHTAGLLWGGVVPDSPQVHLTLPPGTRLRVNGIDARVRRSVETGRRHGLPLTSPGQTFHDLAVDLSLVDVVVLGDAFVRAGPVTPGDLVDAACRLGGPGTLAAGRAAAYVRAGVDSAMETRLRLLLVLAGLPEPVVNVPVRDELTGRVRYRLDLAYPELKIAIEYDGRQHAESTEQWRWDVQRREELEADGWRLVVVLASDVYRSPGRTLDRVVDAVSARGGRVTLRSDTWRRYFPDRSPA